MTCDKYDDLWKPVYTLLLKYWAYCPLSICHLSESKRHDNIELIKKEDSAYLQILPRPRPDKKYKEYSAVALIEKQSKYCTSTQATIWDKETLRRFLVPSVTILYFITTRQ